MRWIFFAVARDISEDEEHLKSRELESEARGESQHEKSLTREILLIYKSLSERNFKTKSLKSNFDDGERETLSNHQVYLRRL